MSKIYIIGNITYREAGRQPLFYIIIAASTVLLLISPSFTLFCFGEHLSMIKEVGLATITFAGLLISILTSYFVLTLEIERLTVMTTLSKPIKRAEFIVGKFLGVLFTCLLAMIFLGLVFVLIYWLKEGIGLLDKGLWEGRYLNHPARVTQDVFNFLKTEMLPLSAGVYLSFLQIMILTSCAIGFASQLPLVLTAVGCLLVFMIGHTSHHLAQALIKTDSIISVIPAKIIALTIPDLSNFDISSLVIVHSPVSLRYILLITFYGLLYSAIILAITILIFGRREMK